MSRKSTQPFTIEHVLLGLIRQQPMHGYEIYQRVKAHAILGMVWSVKQSHVYALLTKLEQAGYVRTSIETQQSYPPRKVLHLTEAGATAFDAWMRSPIVEWEHAQSEFLGKLFFAQRAGDAIVRTLIEQQQHVCTEWLDSLGKHMHRLQPHQSSEWLVLSLRMRQVEAFFDWLRRCAVHFRSPFVVQHMVGILNSSTAQECAERFVDFVCSATGQAILEHYGFLPASDTPSSTLTPAHEALLHSSTSAPHSQDHTLHVFAAATLRDAFEAIAQAFSDLHGGMTISLTFAGSHYLADAIARGEPADVFAAAHEDQMTFLVQGGCVSADGVRLFARNRLVAVTPKDKGLHLATMHDLAKPGLKIALGTEATAIGHYTRTLLEEAEQLACLDAGEVAAVRQNVVFYEHDVRAVLAKVLCGDADVAIVYTSDYCGVEGVAAESHVYPIDALWINTI